MGVQKVGKINLGLDQTSKWSPESAAANPKPTRTVRKLPHENINVLQICLIMLTVTSIISQLRSCDQSLTVDKLIEQPVVNISSPLD